MRNGRQSGNEGLGLLRGDEYANVKNEAPESDKNRGAALPATIKLDVASVDD